MLSRFISNDVLRIHPKAKKTASGPKAAYGFRAGSGEALVLSVTVLVLGTFVAASCSQPFFMPVKRPNVA